MCDDPDCWAKEELERMRQRVSALAHRSRKLAAEKEVAQAELALFKLEVKTRGSQMQRKIDRQRRELKRLQKAAQDGK